jgi:hypothetical protein
MEPGGRPWPPSMADAPLNAPGVGRGEAGVTPAEGVGGAHGSKVVPGGWLVRVARTYRDRDQGRPRGHPREAHGRAEAAVSADRS